MNCSPTRYDWSSGCPRAIPRHITPWRRLILDTIVFGWCIGGLVLMCLLLFACGGAPQSISLDPEFTPSEVAAIQDARDQWCHVKGWCPDFVTDGDIHIERRAGMGVEAAQGGHTDEHANVTFTQWTIWVNGDKLSAFPEVAWVVVAHELGHVQGIDHHGGPECTMFWQHTVPSFDLTCEGQ